MAIQGWTFLISRNQSIDYKTVIAPDFISQAKIRSLLVKVSEDDFTENGTISIRWIESSEVGNFSVVFRVAKARSNDIGQGDNQILKDSFGREIYLIEGLAFQSKPDKIIGTIREVHFNQVHQELIEKYRDFWYYDQISESQAISLKDDESSPIIHLQELNPLIIATKHQLPDIDRYKSTSPRQLAKNRTNYANFLVILVLAILVIVIWNLIASPPQAKVICQSNITIQQITDIQNGIKYLEKLKQTKSKDANPQIWINLASYKTENQPNSTAIQNSDSNNLEKQSNSAPTQELAPKNIEKLEKDNLNSTINLYLNNDYDLIDTAIIKLKKSKIKISKITAIIIQPNDSIPSCSFLTIGNRTS